MANRYWVGGANSWNGTAGTKWSDTSGGAGGQSVPTTADDVFFDGNSGTGAVAISTGNTGAKSINFTGFTGSISGSAAIQIAGNLTLVTGLTWAYFGTITISNTATIITAGKAISGLIISGASTKTLGDSLLCNTSLGGVGFLTVTNSSTFDTSGSNYSITATQFAVNNSSTVNLNASTVSLTYSSAVSAFSISASSTLNAGTSQINIANTTDTFVGNGKTFYNVTYTSSFIDSLTISGANTFNNLTVTNRSTSGVALCYFDNNQTVNGTFTVTSGGNATRRMLFSATGSTTKTLTCASVSLTDVDFRGIVGAGTASWTGTRIGDAGGNSGITAATPKNVWWNGAGGNWNETKWATSSGGSPNVNNYPLPQDTAIFDATGLSSGGTITFISANIVICNIDMSARTTNTMTLSTQSYNSSFKTIAVGSWINGTGTILSGDALTIWGWGVTQNITSAGVIFTQRIIVDSPSGNFVLQDNFTTSANVLVQVPPPATIILKNGTINLNGKTLTLSGTSSQFYTDTGTKNITFNGGTLNLNSSSATYETFNNATPTGFTTTAGTGVGTIKINGGFSFVGGGSVYNCTLDQAGSSTLTISGSNTFNNITNSYKSTGATTIRFTASTTTTLNDFTASGESGRVLTIASSSGSVSFTLSKSSGTVSVNYISISRSNATGGATWYAGADSTNGGSNTGWIFSGPPQPAFFLFF